MLGLHVVFGYVCFGLMHSRPLSKRALHWPCLTIKQIWNHLNLMSSLLLCVCVCLHILTCIVFHKLHV